MYKDFEKQVIETKDSSTVNFSWNEYCCYHDYFIQQLSYDRKHNYIHNSLWEFSYV